jgi:hypothetical protein
VERRMGRNQDVKDFDDFLGSSTDSIQEWMREQSRMADGTSVGAPFASATTVTKYVDECERREPSWRVRSGLRLRRGWPVLRAGILRSGARLRIREMASLLGCSTSAAAKMIELHWELVDRDTDYRTRVEAAVRAIHFARKVGSV